MARLEIGIMREDLSGKRVEVAERMLIADLPDNAGTFHTWIGEIHQDFCTSNQGSNREVILGVEGARALRGKEYRETRRVSVDRQGHGLQDIGRGGAVLFVSTNASQEVFSTNKK